MVEVLSKLNDLMQHGNFAKAEVLLFDLLKSQPENYNLNKNLGMALLAQKKYQGALECFEKCYFKDKNDFDVVLNLSFLFLKLQDHEHSINFANDAIKLNPKLSGAYQNLATCRLELLEFEEAKKNAKKVIELRGGLLSEEFLKYSDFINLYADILLAKKDIDEFIKYSEAILDTGIFNGDLFGKLLKQDINKIKPKYLEILEKATVFFDEYKNNAEKNAKVATAHICLAEYHSKKNKLLSEDHFIKANDHVAKNLRSNLLYARQKRYLNLINYFEDFDDEKIIKKIDPEKGEGLIFIIGMPRSGTTLTESILSTAKNIKPGGEKTFFTNNLWNIFEELSKGKIINPEFIEDLGNRYLDTIALQRANSKFFIDKLPANFLFFKFIQLCFPKAKFVHTLRDPWDNAISLFKANFQESVIYASSFFGIANEYANYKAIMRFWKKKYGENIFIDIDYEKLVSDTTNTTKQLWNYCNLEGEYSSDKRKNHYANTASQQQVSKEIYKTSLKKQEFLVFKDKFLDDLEQQNQFWLKRGI